MKALLNHLKNDTRKEFWQVIALFITWRIGLIIILLLSITLIPLRSRDHFLGGGPTNYSISPQLFSWANFDGEHYLSIAIFGYKPLEQAFFPLYPALISTLSKPFSTDLSSAVFSGTLIGLLISHLFFLLALVLLWDLIRIDFSKRIACFTVVFLLIFPTSYYFGSVYNEAMFLFLTVASFYSARKNRWFLAGVFGLIASATRVFGVLLFPALLIDLWQQKVSLKEGGWVFLIPLGFLGYAVYQGLIFGDSLAFYRLQTLVGEQHQPGIVLLPQVYFRYVKMLFMTDYQNPIYPTIILELFTGVFFFLLPLYGYLKKIRLSYILFAFSGFIATTIQGSFSSLPRYVLVLFPGFLVMAIVLSNRSSWVKIFVFSSFIFWLMITTMMFLRGYWVA